MERVGHFLAANGIEDAGWKRSTLISVMGPRAYKLLRSLVAPAKPGEKSFDELVAVMTQRYRFHTRFRQPGELVATYVSELWSLAQTCNFGESLEDMLRDRLVCGIS